MKMLVRVATLLTATVEIEIDDAGNWVQCDVKRAHLDHSPFAIYTEDESQLDDKDLQDVMQYATHAALKQAVEEIEEKANETADVFPTDGTKVGKA